MGIYFEINDYPCFPFVNQFKLILKRLIVLMSQQPILDKRRIFLLIEISEHLQQDSVTSFVIGGLFSLSIEYFTSVSTSHYPYYAYYI